jgi:hypothetical protein
MKKRRSYLLLSLASGALASAAALPACSGTDVSPSANAGAGGFAGSSGPCGGHPCGSIIEPTAGSGGFLTGSVVQPSGGGGPCGIGFCGVVIQPGDAGAAGEAGAVGDAGTSSAPETPGEAGASAVAGASGNGGGGPCGGHVCGLMVMPSGGAGGSKP